MVVLITLLIVASLLVIVLLILAFRKGIFKKAIFWTKWWGTELEGAENLQKANSSIRLIKKQNWVDGPDGEKYDVSTGVLRHIPDRETLEALGYVESKFVTWDKKKFQTKSLGHPIQSVKTAELIRKGNTSGVYAVIENQRRWVPNPETLAAINRNFGEVKRLSDDEFNKFSQGVSLVDASKWSINTLKK
ncbi:MAG: hypothetical protein A2295_04620 [Candidatus Jacksonbacteria bacterium RIFOXYB2_FULL_44_15]|nr:MAG: hypothetical protein A2240_05050 [Candidatus Jacksonbacteria bacterium RIFOXYA2_FULL_43_12]OGY77921.1 MAG: hypothetical protein A2295_04620 [Candidatus Jacksonbacteria bacterium RIFOXYB2_FULL_44_15]